MQFIRKAVFQAIVFLLVSVSASWAGTGEKVTVMTKNMDAGTDLGFVVAYLQTNLLLGVQLTFQEVLKNNYPLRPFLLAQEITAAKPDVVGLQEATLWRTGPDPDHATDVMVDQLALLLDALAAQGQPYSVVAVNTLTDVAFPISGGEAVRFTDRDVIIARAGFANRRRECPVQPLCDAPPVCARHYCVARLAFGRCDGRHEHVPFRHNPPGELRRLIRQSAG
jgi:hypothetical protein